MQENNYSKMTPDQLKKSIKTTTFISGMLGGSMFVLFLTGVFDAIQGHVKITSIAIPLCFLPLLLVNVNNIKKMKVKLKNREANK